MNTISKTCILLIFPVTAGLFLHAQVTPRPATLTKHVARIIDLSNKEDSIARHLRNMDDDTTLMNFIENEANSGRINAYNSDGRKLSNKEWEPMSDTVTLVDPITHAEVQKVVEHTYSDANLIHNFKLIEEWTFNTLTGDTHVKILYVVPFYTYQHSYDSTIEINEIFWIRYDDLKDVIARYDRLHPTHTFASKIWNDYFYTDIKPTLIK